MQISHRMCPKWDGIEKSIEMSSAFLWNSNSIKKLSLNLSAPKYKINWIAQRTPFLSGIAIKWRRNGNIDGKSQLKIRFCPENGKSDCVPLRKKFQIRKESLKSKKAS